MTTYPSGISIISPKIRDQSLVRRFVSQGGRGYVAVGITGAGGPVDPDPGTLTLRVWRRDAPSDEAPGPEDVRGELVLEVGADELHRADTGKYDFEIGPGLTGQRGVLVVEWGYQVDGKDFAYTDHIQILGQMPLYDSLSDEDKSVVEAVTWMFGDLFDSTEGGPYLIEPYQTHFDYERIAQLSQMAVTRMNTTGYPITQWGFGPVPRRVPADFRDLLIMGTYLEVIRHLTRSYVEIPARVNMAVTYLDRRDYMQRWQSILNQEFPEWQRMVKAAKRTMLGLSRGALLVAGGLYGGGGGSRGVFQSGQWAGAARAFRFYPAAPAVAGWAGMV